MFSLGVIDNVHPESMHIFSSGLSTASHHFSGCSVGLSRLILSTSTCAACRADFLAIATAVRRGFWDDLVCLSVELVISGSSLVIMGESFVSVEIVSFSMDAVIMDDSFLSVEIDGSFCVEIISFSVDGLIMDDSFLSVEIDESYALVCVISVISLSMSLISFCVCIV